MDALDGIPNEILGHELKTRTQIILTCLIPVVLELIVFLVLIPTDILVTIQLVIDGHNLWAVLTLVFIWTPAILCFFIIIISPSQWPEPWKYCYGVNFCFFIRQCLHLVFFPISAIYRFSRRIFWSVESLMHEKHTPERQHAVWKAAETSPLELYHFLQAFTQSAPQIILQLHILLRKNMFRNYDTTTVQVISIVFSLIQMAMTVMSFQRFESQKIVGRNYPWQSSGEVQFKKKLLHTKTSTAAEVMKQKSAKVIEPSFPNVLQNFKTQSSSEWEDDNAVELRKTMNIGPQNFDQQTAKEESAATNCTDDFKTELQGPSLRNIETKAEISAAQNRRASDTVDGAERRSPYSIKKPMSRRYENIPDEDLIEEMTDYKRQTDDTLSASTYSENNSFRQNERVTSSNFERTPSLPPPPKPTSSFPYLQSLNRLSTFKDMLIFNAEHLIKENVPRLPAHAFEHHHHPSTARNSTIRDDDESDDNQAADQVDFIMPTRKCMIEGIEQDDFLGKYISFSGWIMFLLMRMISLSVFSVFYLQACAYLCVGHYVVMLLCIFYETKFHEKLERNYFHVFLAYIYVFCILEFKIKFIHLKTWYIGYFLFVFLQNLTITLIWYNFMEFQSWWFHFMFNVIIGSGMLSVSCLTFYYFYLRPKDKVLFAND